MRSLRRCSWRSPWRVRRVRPRRRHQPPVPSAPTTSTTSTTTTSTHHHDHHDAPELPGHHAAGLGGNWTCTFDDEFNGTSLNTHYWQPQLTATSLYVAGPDCYVNNPSTISESGGYLNLSVVKLPQFKCVGHYNSQYETGMVTTRSLFTQTYGAFEVNAKLPVSTAPGLQETFWLYPQNLTYGKWPASGEIDFAEFYSQYPNLDVPYIHYTNSASDPNVTSHNCTINPTQFNTYGVDWTPHVDHGPLQRQRLPDRLLAQRPGAVQPAVLHRADPGARTVRRQRRERQHAAARHHPGRLGAGLDAGQLAARPPVTRLHPRETAPPRPPKGARAPAAFAVLHGITND